MVERHLKIKLKNASSFTKKGILKLIHKIVKIRYFTPLDIMKGHIEDRKGKILEKRRLIFSRQFISLKNGIKFISAFDINFSIYNIRFFIEQNLKGDDKTVNDLVNVYLSLKWKDII